MKLSTKKLVLCALFVALSAIGANIKIFGTIAFDSMPAFFGALLLGGFLGGIIGFLGHMLTAMTSGFPFGIAVHFIIALSMVITVALYHFAYTRLLRLKLNAIVAAVSASALAALVNGPGMLFVLIPLLGAGAFYAMLLPLLVVSMANSILGFGVYQAVAGSKAVLSMLDK